MFSKIDYLEKALNSLLDTLKDTEKKRYTANQAFKAENIHLAEGATININMQNTIVSTETVKECLGIINDLKPILPTEHNNLDSALLNYEYVLVKKALVESKGYAECAEKLGVPYRRVRYLIDKHNFDKPRKKLLETKENEDIIDIKKIE